MGFANVQPMRRPFVALRACMSARCCVCFMCASTGYPAAPCPSTSGSLPSSSFPWRAAETRVGTPAAAHPSASAAFAYVSGCCVAQTRGFAPFSTRSSAGVDRCRWRAAPPQLSRCERSVVARALCAADGVAVARRLPLAVFGARAGDRPLIVVA